MANNDNEIAQHILTLKDQVLRWAAPKNHQSGNTIYGEADSDNYGHVKKDENIPINSDGNDHTVSSAGIVAFVNSKINNLRNEINDTIDGLFNIITTANLSDSHKTNNKYNIPTAFSVLQAINGKFNVETEVTSSSTNGTTAHPNIPTSKAVWDAISSYEDLLTGVSLAKPKHYSGSIDNLRTPGYYQMTKDDNNAFISYYGESIRYTNALVVVKKTDNDNDNRVIQHIYTTEDANGVYKPNGCEYTRYYMNGNWRPWAVVHIPYRQIQNRINSTGRNVISGSVTIFENTNGFTIKWDQADGDQKKYSVYQKLYEYAPVCTFNPALPIDGPYVFGNLIGRMDIRIKPDAMEIRSNVPPGGRIIGMEETYFVPRKE